MTAPISKSALIPVPVLGLAKVCGIFLGAEFGTKFPVVGTINKSMDTSAVWVMLQATKNAFGLVVVIFVGNAR